jgi:hypothetical protein
MSPPPTLNRPRRLAVAVLVALLVGSGALVASASPVPAVEPGATLTWGVKSSFRNYVTGPIAGGSITPEGGVTVDGSGAFVFPAVDGAEATDESFAAGFEGSVRFVGHEGALDLTVADVRVDVDGASGALVADVSSKALDDEEVVEYPDVELASLDLTAVDPVEASGFLTWTDVPATLTTDGAPAFADFYPAGTALDPLTITLPEAVVWEPEVTLSQADGLNPYGDTVTVTGEGFEPDVNISTRPPVPVGMPTGVYVVFGRFADTWKPSEGAPGSARTVLDQMWPLPAASKAAAEAAFGPNPQYAVLAADGSFEVELDVSLVAGPGNFGIYTYAAGGAAPNATQETFTPVTFEYASFPDVPESHLFHEEITWLATNEYASGYSDGTFRPAEDVTREAFASFLYRMAGSPDVPPGAPTFSDVPDTHLFHDAISWLAAEGVVQGYPDGTFRPGSVVNREATAAFLHRLAGSPAAPGGAPTFSDVPDTHLFFDEISWLAGVEITVGYADGTFRPGQAVSREAVAAFLFRYDALAEAV